MTFPIPDTALENHTALLGKTGGGKTSTGKLIVEHVVAEGYRVCILDPVKSDWWGITSSADGKKPGLPFNILGGPHGHVALHASAGKAIGQLVGSGTLPLSIIDMADFEAGGLQKFFIDFAQSLLRNARGVTYLVIEEAHEFAPKERAGFGGENMALHWAKKLATAGRSMGIRLIVATQRTQSLHNAVLGSCETMIAHRLSAPADQEPVLKWLKANGDKETLAKVEQSLSSLPKGTGWVCSGEAKMFEQVAFPKFATYDNTATPTKDGKQSHIEVQTAKVDRDQLKAIIGAAAKDAEANDPRALKAEVARLRNELVKAGQKIDNGPGLTEAEFLNEVRQAHLDGHAVGYEKGFTEAATLTSSGFANAVTDAIKAFHAPVPKSLPRPAPSVLPISPPRAKPIPQLAHMRQNASSGPGLTAPQQKIMRSLLFWSSMGKPAPSREMVAGIAGYSPGTGNFNNLLGQMKAMGLIDYPVAGSVSVVAPTGFQDMILQDEAKAILLGRLSGPQSRIINTVLIRGREPTREAVAADSGYSPGTGNFNNLLGQLRSLDIIEYPRPGQVALTDWVAEILGGA